MDTKKIAYFLEVVKAKSISKAAKNLGIDQSILNRAVRGLEEEAGAKLYIHYDKTFKLTEKGKLACKYFRKIMGNVSDFKDFMTNRSKRTELNILTSNGMANFFLIDALSDFLEKNKNIHLIFSTDDLIQKLDISVDICIGPRIIDDGVDNFYLFSYFLKLYASRKYLEKHGYPQVPSDLDNHQLIGYSTKYVSRFMDFDWHLRYGSPNGIQRTPYLQVSSSYAIKRAAENHLGIIVFSKMLVVRDKLDLMAIFPNDVGLKVDVYFSHRRDHDNLEEILLYRDFIAAYFRELSLLDQ